MAYPPYSTRFLLRSVSVSTAQTYTVPANRVAIVTCMTALKSAAATPVDVLASVTDTGSATTASIWFASFIGTTKIESALWNGHVVLNPGDVLTMQRSGAAGSAMFTASGYLLTIT